MISILYSLKLPFTTRETSLLVYSLAMCGSQKVWTLKLARQIKTKISNNKNINGLPLSSSFRYPTKLCFSTAVYYPKITVKVMTWLSFEGWFVKKTNLYHMKIIRVIKQPRVFFKFHFFRSKITSWEKHYFWWRHER